MIKKVFGNRTDAPAFFDMAARFKPRGAVWYGAAFRIGDRAAAHVYIGEWREKYPDRRLIIAEDSLMDGTEYSRYLPGEWLFKDFADELWIVDKKGETVPEPPGDALYNVSLWRIWRKLYENRIFIPRIKPLAESMISAGNKLNGLNVPPEFITIQPLFDAKYNLSRNGTIKWWEEVCVNLSCKFPTVILGDEHNIRMMKFTGKSYYFCNPGLNPMESLAVISMAKVHVGGATGTTLWSPMFNTPTVAVYRKWNEYSNGPVDERPMPFGAPVVWALLEGDAGRLVEAVEPIWEERSAVCPLEGGTGKAER